MKKSIITVAVLLSGFLGACGGNVKTLQCSGVDWNGYGYKIAQSGKSPREFNHYRDGCGERLEKGAMDAYLDGYTRGIVEFCTYENGYASGLNNQPLSDVCPVELRTSYAKGHGAGLFEAQEKKRDFEKMRENADAASTKTSVISSDSAPK